MDWKSPPKHTAARACCGRAAARLSPAQGPVALPQCVSKTALWVYIKTSYIVLILFEDTVLF